MIKIGDAEPVVYDPAVHTEIDDNTKFIAVVKTHPVNLTFNVNNPEMGYYETGE